MILGLLFIKEICHKFDAYFSKNKERLDGIDV